MTEKKSSKEKSDADKPDARKRLLLAGMDIFGELGFEAVTTRQLASKANVNLASIPYYFGTKEQLYNECIAEFIKYVSKHFAELRAEIIAELGDKNISHSKVIELLEKLMLRIVDISTGNSIHQYSPLILREHLTPSPAFEILYENYFLPLHKLVARLVAVLDGLDEDDSECILRAHVLLGQVVGVLAGRNLLLKRLGRSIGKGCKLSTEEADRVKAIISNNIRAVFSGQNKS